MHEAFLVGGVRTPIGRHGGALAGVRPDDLAALVVRSAVRRAAVQPEAVEEVVLGNANGAGEDSRNVARMAVLLAGLPVSVPGLTVNRLCGSGMSAITTAAQMVRSGAADVVVAGGVESMTRAPWVQAKPDRAWAKPGPQFDTSLGWRFVNPVFAAQEGTTRTMPETAEAVADLDGIGREESDAFALRSHQRAVAAIDAGRFADELIPVEAPAGRATVTVGADEGPRRDTSLDALARLQPVVRPGGAVTAGNASSLNDGASAIVVASAAAVERLGLRPRARFVDATAVGVEPGLMGLGSVPAVERLMQRTGVALDAVAAVELNEAFAAQVIACMRRLDLDPELVNADGGAIALGHPLGSSGCRIVVTLLGRMEREGSRFGLASMCVGVGQGTALLLEAA